MALEPVPATEINIEKAASHLAAGHLVAFPTETVYGLGANACNDRAVAAIFEAKGRPSFNPLIVHVADLEAAAAFAVIEPLAEKLAARFWPGSLTMILNLRHGAGLSERVTAGLSSVAIRVPVHPVARALLRTVHLPIAAPSANRSGHVSATTAAHVAADFDGARPPEHLGAPTLAMILDDGPCHLGLESTIIDVRSHIPVLLRPGAVTMEALCAIVGDDIPVFSPLPDTTGAATNPTAPTSPGQLASHYAPSKSVYLDISEPCPGQALLAFGEPPSAFTGEIINLSRTRNLAEASANLFAALRTLDRSAATSIAVMPIPTEGLGRAINDRLRRAAAPRS